MTLTKTAGLNAVFPPYDSFAALGGVAAGRIASALLPTLAAAASGVDLKTIVAQLAAAGIGGALTTVLVGIIKNLAAKS